MGKELSKNKIVDGGRSKIISVWINDVVKVEDIKKAKELFHEILYYQIGHSGKISHIEVLNIFDECFPILKGVNKLVQGTSKD